MSRLGPNQMTVRKVESLKDGTHSDGGNLCLTVAGKARTWSVRYTSPTTGRRREIGLGSYRDIGLAAARELASEARQLLRRGVDPIEHRKTERAGRRERPALTFHAVAERYIVDQTPGWRDVKLPGIWRSSLRRHAYPRIGDKAVGEVATDDVVAVLRPIWETTTETADRVRSRIERILDYARSQGWREGENPARWRGHLAYVLPKPSTVSQVEHYAAVPFRDVAVVMAGLARSQGFGAMAVRFAVTIRRGPRRLVRPAGAWLRRPDRPQWRSALASSRAAAPQGVGLDGLQCETARRRAKPAGRRRSSWP